MATAHARPTPLALPRHGLRRLWDGCPSLSCSRGEYVYFPGDPATSVYLVRSGAVRVGRLHDSGRELTLDILGAGAVFGEGALLGDGPRAGFAQALAPVEVAALDAGGASAALRRGGDLALEMVRSLADRSRRLESRVARDAVLDCRGRLGQTLADLADRFGSDGPDGRRLELPLTHQDLACLVGAARETVTPLLGRMREEGIIKYGRGRWLVRDRSRLLEG